MDCGVPFCHSPLHNSGQNSGGCPVENLIPEWNRLVSDGRWVEALQVLHSTNNFPEFTGKLCPAPCEQSCVLSINSSPVTIRSIESSIIELGFTKGDVKPVPALAQSGKKVAIVGSGPAGLAAAQQLARLGHIVRVYEKGKLLGGLLRYGIPDFKMEKKIIDRRLGQLRAEGVQFFTNTQAGRDISSLQLMSENDALCIAIGAEAAREMPLPGRNLQGIYPAMEYLVEANKRVSGELSADAPQLSDMNARGKRVVILGGGDTGSDCLGTAMRQGATQVTQLELMSRPPEDGTQSGSWPNTAYRLRSSHAHEESQLIHGKRDWAVLTRKFRADPAHPEKLGSLECVRVQWKENRFEEVAGSAFEIPADLVLVATGFTGVVRGGLVTELGLNLDTQGRIQVDAQWMTNKRGVFAAGDASRGASLIVWAISEGRKMAASVDNYLSNITQ